jgi:hypothetical protein
VNSIWRKPQDWARSYFFILEAAVVGLALLFHFGGYRIGDNYGMWPSFTLLGLLSLLLISSLIVLGSKRQRLGIVGLFVTALVVADGFFFSVIVP